MAAPPIVVSVILFAGSFAFAFSACSKPEPVHAAVDKVHQSATSACDGLTPVWIDSSTIECVKETL